MKQTRFIMFTLCALLLMLVACTQKDNLTGTSDSGLRPETAILDQSYRLDAFCYQDTAINKGSVGSFSVGMHNDLQAVGLIYFDEMPDSIECVETGLRLVMEARHGAAGQTIRLARVLQPWDETECDWTYAGEDTLWEEPRWEALDGAEAQTTDSDTLFLPLPTSLVQSWIDGDTLTYGLAIYTEEQGICQFYSSEADESNPKLIIRYTSGDSLAEYGLYANEDVFISNGAPENAQLEANTLCNVTPTLLYMKWDLSLQALQAVTGITDTLEIRQTTINRAEVVIPVDEALSFIPEDTFTAYAYRLKSESALDSLPVAGDQLLAYSYTDVSSYADGEIAIDVTPIIQGMTAGIKQNYGIVVTPLLRDRNLGFLTLMDGWELRIMYTRPNLGE